MSTADYFQKAYNAFNGAWKAFSGGPAGLAAYGASWLISKYGPDAYKYIDNYLKDKYKDDSYAKWKRPYANKWDPAGEKPTSGWQDAPNTGLQTWNAIYSKQLLYGGDNGMLAKLWGSLFGTNKYAGNYKVIDFQHTTPAKYDYFLYNTFTLEKLISTLQDLSFKKFDLNSYTTFKERLRDAFYDQQVADQIAKPLYNYLCDAVAKAGGLAAYWSKNVLKYSALTPWWLLKWAVTKGLISAGKALLYGPPMLAKSAYTGVSALHRFNKANSAASDRVSKFLADNVANFLKGSVGSVYNRLGKISSFDFEKFLDSNLDLSKFASKFKANAYRTNLLGAKRARTGGATADWSYLHKKNLRGKQIYSNKSAYPLAIYRGNKLKNINKMTNTGNKNDNINMNANDNASGIDSMSTGLFDMIANDEPASDDAMEEPIVPAGGAGGAPNNDPSGKFVLKKKIATNSTKTGSNWWVPGIGAVSKAVYDFYQKLLYQGYDKHAAADIVRDDAVEDWQVADDYAVEDADELKRWKYASYSNENWNSAMIAAPKRRRGRFNLNNYKRSFLSFRRKKSYFGFDVTPFKLSCSFRAWHLGNYNAPYIANQSVKTDCQWFKLLVDAENTVGNLTTSSNYAECITGADILTRIMQDNTVTAPIWKMFNLFCLKGVSVKISCSRRAVANAANVYPSSANYVLALYWGKDNANQLPVPGAGQTKYDYLFDKDNAMRFTTTNVDLRPYSKYFRARYDSMGWGGSTWNSIEKLNTAPFLVCIENQQEYYAELSPIFDVTFDVYILLKGKNA